MQKYIINTVSIVFLFSQSLFSQTIDNENNCPKEVTYFAYNLPIDGANWFVPIKYNITEKFIDLKIRRKNIEELFIRFKIIENLNCDFKDIGNCDLKYRVLTYDEETNSYEERQSEIEFKFSNNKGQIYIQHPNFPKIISNAATSPDDVK